MARTYSANVSTLLNQSRDIAIDKPFDTRSVVDTESDLYEKSTFQMGGSIVYTYVGMMVTTKDTGDVYVLTRKPVGRENYATTITWKKIGESSGSTTTFSGALICDSASELVSNDVEAYAGMIAVVKPGNSESEDEGGLYVLLDTPNTVTGNWLKIGGGSGSSIAVNYTDVIKTDGSTPESGSGVSISSEGAYEEEVYVDSYLKAGVFYTSRGLNSNDKNGGDLEESRFIELTNGGESYIRLYSSNDSMPNWINVHIVDDSLGFGASDVHYVDSNDELQDMEGQNLSLVKEALIMFDVDVDFTGMDEWRRDTDETYVFGSTGSTYADTDIYTVNILPTVYAYADGSSVKVLTEGDRTEIVNMIDNAIESISDEDINSLFEDEEPENENE